MIASTRGCMASRGAPESRGTIESGLIEFAPGARRSHLCRDRDRPFWSDMPEELRAPGCAGNDRFRCRAKFITMGVEPAKNQHGSVCGIGALACSEQHIRVARGHG